MLAILGYIECNTPTDRLPGIKGIMWFSVGDSEEDFTHIMLTVP